MQVMLEILTKKMESVDTQLVHLATTPANSADPVTTDKTEEATPNAEMGKEDIKAEKPSTEEENLDFLRSLEVEQVFQEQEKKNVLGNLSLQLVGKRSIFLCHYNLLC